MALPKTYSTGTVSVSNGSTAVTGSGTSWLSTIKADDVFCRAGYSVRVASVTDDTHLVLAENWPGTGLSGSAYEIRITFDGPEFLQTARKIWSQLSSLLFYVADATSATYQDFYEQTTNGTNKVRLIAAASLAADVTATLTAAAADLWTRWTSATASVAANLAFPESTGGGTNKVTLKAADTLAADRTFTMPDSDVTFGSKGISLLATTTNAGAQSAIGVREVLSANRTYYVRTDGSDSNNGLANTAGGAFLTVQKALNVIKGLDFNGQSVTVQVADGTYTGSVTVPVTVGQALTSDLTIQGNSGTPGNVIISTTSADCFAAVSGVRALIKDMELRTTTAGYCLDANGAGTELQYTNLRFGACANDQILASGGALITCIGNYSIVGAAARHWNSDRGIIEVGNRTITITGTPAFSSAFANASQGHIRAFNNTYSGSATGVRYNASMNGTIQTFGAGSTALPGNSAGSTATGGQYA